MVERQGCIFTRRPQICLMERVGQISLSSNAVLKQYCTSQVEITHKTVTFPPCRTNESIYQTTMIVNYGDTPASFAFQTTGLGPTFTIMPSQGIVPAKGNVLVSGDPTPDPQWHPPPCTLVFTPRLTCPPPLLSPQVALRFSPKDEKPINARTICTFNGVAMTAIPLVLAGAAFAPRLAFDVPGIFCFRCRNR